jgi:hypothetical protein
MLTQDKIDEIAAEVAAEYLPPGAVVSVRSRPDTGSDGDDILRVLYVLKAASLSSVTGQQTLRTLSGLQDRLQEAQESRFAVVEYATDAELAQDGGT